MDKDQYVWIANHPEFEWWPGHVVSRSDNTLTAEDLDGARFEVPLHSAIFVKDPYSEGVDDLMDSDDLNEGSLLHAIRTRYLSGKIYTAIGNSITIALNPYKPLSIYSEQIKTDYALAETCGLVTKPPHLYKVAEIIYRSLQEHSMHQSVILTGESGSGKTESTKLILNYLTTHSGHKGLEAKILFTNPVLEAFGNAQTVRNDNSSRFGKYIELEIEGRVKTARIENYLLEKSRIVKQSPGERNYHIFYQLYHSDDPELAERLQLGLSVKWEYMNLNYIDQTEKRLNDKRKYSEIVDCLAGLGFSGEEVQKIFNIVASVLHIGNFQINGDEENSRIATECRHLAVASELCGIEPESFQTLICFKHITDPGTKQKLITNLSRSSALINRDTLAKTIYFELFNWLTQKLNSTISNSDDAKSSQTHLRYPTVGLLDIFGFEIFDDNSLEQLCINYANEKLQYHFNEHVFVIEQNQYKSEGIAWTGIDFEDNSKTIALLEGRPFSIMTILDQECVYTTSKDITLLEKFRSNFEKHPSFVVRQLKSKKEKFGIHHYASEVYYTIDNFIEKNRNSANKELTEILVSSTNSVLSDIFGQILKVLGNTSRRPDTVVKQFGDQLSQLLKKLDQSKLSYLRCIKPNNVKIADYFESKEVLAQLKATGVLQVVKIRKQGYPFRIEYEEFAKDYLALLKRFGIRKDGCEELLREIYDRLLLKLFSIAKKPEYKIKALQNKEGDFEIIKGLRLTYPEMIELASSIPKDLVGKDFDCLIQFGSSKLFTKEFIKSLLDYLQEKSAYQYALVIQTAYRAKRRRSSVKKICSMFRSYKQKKAIRAGMIALYFGLNCMRTKFSRVQMIVRSYHMTIKQSTLQRMTQHMLDMKEEEHQIELARLEDEKRATEALIEVQQKAKLLAQIKDRSNLPSESRNVENEDLEYESYSGSFGKYSPLEERLKQSGPVGEQLYNSISQDQRKSFEEMNMEESNKIEEFYSNYQTDQPNNLMIKKAEKLLNDEIDHKDDDYIQNLINKNLRKPSPNKLAKPVKPTKPTATQLKSKPPTTFKKSTPHVPTSPLKTARKKLESHIVHEAENDHDQDAISEPPKLDLDSLDASANGIWEINKKRFNDVKETEKVFLDKSLLDPLSRQIEEKNAYIQELENQVNSLNTQLSELRESSRLMAVNHFEKQKNTSMVLFAKEKAIEELKKSLSILRTENIHLESKNHELKTALEKQSQSPTPTELTSEELRRLRAELKQKSDGIMNLQQTVNQQNIKIANLKLKKNELKQSLKIKEQLLDNRIKVGGSKELSEYQRHKVNQENDFLKKQNSLYEQIFGDLFVLLKYKTIETKILGRELNSAGKEYVRKAEGDLQTIAEQQQMLQKELDLKMENMQKLTDFRNKNGKK